MGQSNESLRIRLLLHCCNCTKRQQQEKSVNNCFNHAVCIFEDDGQEDGRLLPLAVRVECHTVDWAEVTFDPAKLLFIGSMEEPEYSKEGGYHHNRFLKGLKSSIKRGIHICHVSLPGLKLPDPGGGRSDLHGLLSTSHHHLSDTALSKY